MSAKNPSTVSAESPRVLSRELVLILCVLALVLLLALLLFPLLLTHRDALLYLTQNSLKSLALI